MSIDHLTRKPPSDPKGFQPKRKRSLAWLLPTGLLYGFLVILALLFGERLLPAIPVKTAPVITIRAGESLTKQPAVDTIPQKKGVPIFQASGWVEPDPYPIYVSTLTNGVVEKVHALEGQQIKKGSLVATLIDEDAKLDLQSAQQKHLSLKKQITAHCTGFQITNAEITAAHRKIDALKFQLTEAIDTSSRLDNLSKGSVSQQKIFQARLAVEKQRAFLAEAQAKIPELNAHLARLKAEEIAMASKLNELAIDRDRAELALARTKISAPIDGTVLHLHAAPGMKRMLNMDSPKSAVIIELYQLDQLQARIDVPLNEAAALSAGQSVELVSDLLPDQSFAGTVTRISGQADLQRNTLQAKVAIENPDPRLRPDMLVRAKFFSSGSTASSKLNTSGGSDRLALFVPEQALVNDSQVWVASSDLTAEKRSLKLGEESRDGHRRVLEGLLSGESVILPPHTKLSEGSRVTVSN